MRQLSSWPELAAAASTRFRCSLLHTATGPSERSRRLFPESACWPTRLLGLSALRPCPWVGADGVGDATAERQPALLDVSFQVRLFCWHVMDQQVEVHTDDLAVMDARQVARRAAQAATHVDHPIVGGDRRGRGERNGVSAAERVELLRRHQRLGVEVVGVVSIGDDGVEQLLEAAHVSLASRFAVMGFPSVPRRRPLMSGRSARERDEPFDRGRVVGWLLLGGEGVAVAHLVGDRLSGEAVDLGDEVVAEVPRLSGRGGEVPAVDELRRTRRGERTLRRASRRRVSGSFGRGRRVTALRRAVLPSRCRSGPSRWCRRVRGRRSAAPRLGTSERSADASPVMCPSTPATVKSLHGVGASSWLGSIRAPTSRSLGMMIASCSLPCMVLPPVVWDMWAVLIRRSWRACGPSLRCARPAG